MSDLKDFIIENGVLTKYVGEGGDVVIPDSVTSIGNWAFSRCSSLTTITIPDSVTSIGNWAFDFCLSLTSITISGRVTSIGYYAFNHCRSLTSITIPDSVTNIDDYAFHYCTSLTSITIHDSVISIGNSAFKNCNNIREFVLFSTVKAFDGSNMERIWDYFLKADWKFVMMYSSLKHIPDLIINSAKASRKIKANKSKLFSMAINEDNAEIVEYLFSLYKTIALEDLNRYIEKAKKTVAIKAFLLNYKATHYSVEMQKKHEADKFEKELGFKERTPSEWKKIYTVETNGNTATIKSYKGNETDISIPEKIGKYTVTAIAESAFSPFAKRINSDIINSRKNIISITIPGSVTSIGHSAFKGCTKLTSVSIPYGVTRISNYTFSDCLSLAYVTIPDSVTSIGYSAFEGCSSLDSIIIPNNVIYIGHDAFSDCPKLTLHAPAGSCAENCAKMNIIPFVAE